MSGGMRWGLVVLGFVIFLGWVVYGSMSGSTHTCEVCLEFDGQLVCRSGSGPGEAEAVAAAQESVCGGNASGMTESIACRNRRPESVSCVP